MRNRAAVLLLSALGLAASLTAAADPIALVATGTVVSKGADALVVHTDDHGHRITFAIDRQTALPGGLAVGRRVRVVYHANGTAGQTADQVTLLEGRGPNPPGASR